MKLKKLKFKNISSYGNVEQEIDLTGKPGFYMVYGPNGMGKSTISQAIKYGWYGKVDKLPPKDLVNRRNKNGWIEITGEASGHQIVVERTLSPNAMALTVDGVPYDKSRYGNQGPNEYLTEQLLELPFHVFNNIISLSINDFKSFLTMGAKDKRDIIDRVLGYHVLNTMKEIVKKDAMALKQRADAVDTKISVLRETLIRNGDAMTRIAAKIAEANDEGAKVVIDDIQKFTELMTFHRQKMSEFTIRHGEAKTNLSKFSDVVAQARSAVSYAKQRIRLYDNSQCPECGVTFDSEFHKNKRAGYEEDIRAAEAALAGHAEDYKRLSESKALLDTESLQLTEKGSKINSKVQELTAKLRTLQSPPGVDSQLEEIERLVQVTQVEIDERSTERVDVQDALAWTYVVEDAVGETGLKRMAIERVVPAFNVEIARMMAMMHLDYSVEFDSNFDAKVLEFGEEINPQTLSFGESKKVDFVILVAWIRLMKLKFPSLNMMFLDELMASVDPDGIHSILQILHDLCTELELNIFMINQLPLPHAVFDYQVEFTKKDGFSSLKVSPIK